MGYNGLPVMLGELTETLMDVIKHRIVQPMVAGQQNTAAHDLVGFRISSWSDVFGYILKPRLTRDVACKNDACLDITFLQKYLHVPSGERCICA